MKLLELTGITKSYESPDRGAPVPILKGIDLSVSEGESMAVVGPSGSGKSTLLNIMGGLDHPSSGSVRLEGKKLTELSEKELAFIRNRKIGFVFQLHHLLPQLNVLENTMLPAIPFRVQKKSGQLEDRARDLLRRAGLGERLRYRPGQLSGGERQRVALVRALINSPKLLLADEPTGSLDSAASRSLTGLLIELNREEGVTLVVVTHSKTLAERMNRRFRLHEGVLKEETR
jgi:ABC-type lipoprotein export system ATPase subunit